MKITNIEEVEYDEPIPVYCLTVDHPFHAWVEESGSILANCEGLSAMGSIVAGRDANLQGVLPVRGKVLNLMRLDLTKKKDRERFQKNSEIEDMIKALGAGAGEQFDIDKCRYGKVVFACFTGDTKVASLDGNSYTFNELISNNTKELWVYSRDKHGNIVPAKATNIRKTGTTEELIHITLDNGHVIKCTPDHMLMLNTGEYISAENLSGGESLMPLHTYINADGYEEFFDDKSNSWEKTYRRVAENIFPKEKEAAEKRLEKEGHAPNNNGVCVHHKDFNKLNNNPDNLQWMTMREHFVDGHGGWTSYNVSQKHRDRLSYLHAETDTYSDNYFGVNGYNGSELQRENLKKAHEDGKYECVYERFKNYNYSDQHSEVVANVNKSEKHIISVKKSKIAKVIKFLELHNFPVDEYHFNYYKNIGAPAYSRIFDVFSSIEEAIEFADTKEFDFNGYTPSCEYVTPTEKRFKTSKVKIAKVLKKLADSNKEINKENYESARAFNTTKWGNICEYFDSIEEAIEFSENMNHKVVNVERVKVDTQDVYCLTVEGYHNFLVDTSENNDFDYFDNGENNGNHFNGKTQGRTGCFVHQCDSDVDGMCINVLLLGVFYKLFRPLIEQGRVYQCVTPFYELKYRKNGQDYFLYANNERERMDHEAFLKSKNIKYTLGRAKGLGELNADVFHDRVLEPTNRKLIRITMKDAEKAYEMLNLAIGEAPADDRKEWMIDHNEAIDDLGLYS